MATPAGRLLGITGLVTMACMLVCAGAVGAQGVHVALTPASSEVAPGAVFDLSIEIAEAGSAFNGFDAVIGYDPAALTLIPLSPTSLQEGTLMTGACGNQFHRFQQATGTATVSDLLLCAGVSLTGPGQVYHLRFQASNTPQITQVTFLPGLQFYNAGLFVNPAYSANAIVGIGTTLGADTRRGAKGLGLRVAPNPARGGTAFVVESARPGPQRIRVVDIRGRLVRQFEDSVETAGTRLVSWDGRDASGRPLPAGVYVVTVESEGRSVSSRVSLVR